MEALSMNKVKTSPATALLEAHHALLKDIAALEPFLQSNAPAPPDEVLRRLETLRGDLGKHFRFEEQNGYMQEVLAQAPQHERRVESLREEHDKLWQALAALLRQAKDAPALGEDFRQKVRGWIDQMRDHERRENLLVEEAFNTDVPAED